MMLCNTGSSPAGDVKAEEPDQHDVLKKGSGSADIIQEEPDQLDFI